MLIYIYKAFLGPRLGGGQNFLLTAGSFYNEREYSGADWLVPFICKYSFGNHKVGKHWISVWCTAGLFPLDPQNEASRQAGRGTGQGKNGDRRSSRSGAYHYSDTRTSNCCSTRNERVGMRLIAMDSHRSDLGWIGHASHFYCGCCCIHGNFCDCVLLPRGVCGPLQLGSMPRRSRLRTFQRADSQVKGFCHLKRRSCRH